MISSARANVSRLGVTSTARAPGLRTRAISASARSGSGTCSIEWTAIAPSKDADGKGSRRMSAATVSRGWPWSTSASMSTPTVSRGASSL